MDSIPPGLGTLFLNSQFGVFDDGTGRMTFISKYINEQTIDDIPLNWETSNKEQIYSVLYDSALLEHINQDTYWNWNYRFNDFTHSIIRWVTMSVDFTSSRAIRKASPRLALNDFLKNYHAFLTNYQRLTDDTSDSVPFKYHPNFYIQDAIAIDEMTAWNHLLFKLWMMGAQEFSDSLMLSSVKMLPTTFFSEAHTAETFENENDILENFMNSVFASENREKIWDHPDLYFVVEAHDIKNPGDKKGTTIFKTQRYDGSGNPTHIDTVITHPSIYESGFAESFMVMPNLRVNYKKGTNFLSKTKGTVIALNTPRHPRLGAISIEWQTMTTAQRRMATTRPRVSYTDVISYINNVKDWCVALKTGRAFIGSKSRKILPFTDYNSFVEHYGTNLEFRAAVDEVVMNRLNKRCFADIMEKFIDGGKTKFIQYEFSQITDPTEIYAIRKQLDFLMAFKRAGTSTILVVKDPSMKKVVLEMRQSLGYDFPVLTEREHLALENARWYAYEDMCLEFDDDGNIISVNREKFSYEQFIRGLYKHSGAVDYWNIDPKIAKQIMLAFGFVPDPSTGIGIQIPNDGKDYEWEGSSKSKFPYDHAMALRLMEWWNRFRSDLCHVEAAIQYDAWS